MRDKLEMPAEALERFLKAGTLNSIEIYDPPPDPTGAWRRPYED